MFKGVNYIVITNAVEADLIRETLNGLKKYKVKKNNGTYTRTQISSWVAALPRPPPPPLSL